MKVAGSAVIGIERDRVWAALQDPAVLVRTIPGCERLEECGPDTYRMTVNAGIASLKGVYQGEVALAEPSAPESFVLKARGQGAPGTVDATVLVRLSETDSGTRVDYAADAVIGGMIGGVGQRMLGSVARKTAGEFFAAVEDHLRAPAGALTEDGPHLPAPAAAGPHPRVRETASHEQWAGQAAPREQWAGQVASHGQEEAALARPAVYERPAKQRTETPPWVLLAAFGMGAGVALTGAAVGWLLGRGRR
ncbi:carbon monoxide dehydrogenase subunit G [Nonomuraea glycinis]|uniref:Carbon monoxide dehydrogenase subunit G n=1 Tax=Nonomuraea glycinis TaxID=2047744 RepID=A0A918AD76_9ACTN|nr:carbon monoxide dehydrogenase subunit G [Nonomuraea glycinis]MCA2182437.1 carbon monoxide dehydrogenase subunit G [Nonomuraea glycinis]GGP16186.1 carbon monoxide dehydrogenase subunit G [Nonomuraea glycinis]